MNSKYIRGLVTGGLLVVVSLALPSDAHAQRSGVEIWEANCGRCHLIQPTNKYVAKDWRSIGLHMAITARLTSDERDAVIAFLVSGARSPDGRQAMGPEPADTPDAGIPALTQEQVDQLAQYLASLGSPATHAPARTGNR